MARSYGPTASIGFANRRLCNGLDTQIEEATAQLQQRGFIAAPRGGGFPWLLGPLIVGMLMQSWKSTAIYAAVPVSLALTALASLLPSFVGFPVPHGIMDSVVAINAAAEPTVASLQAFGGAFGGVSWPMPSNKCSCLGGVDCLAFLARIGIPSRSHAR